MCQFYIQHGGGRKWYLEAKHYAADVVSSPERVRDLLDWLQSESLGEATARLRLRWLLGLPFIGRAAGWALTRHMQRVHFGQVLALEDVREVFRIAETVTQFPCVCRKAMLGDTDARYCFGVGNFFRDYLGDAPELSQAGEELTVEEACLRVESFEGKGLVHTVWTLDTPFIIGVCSCKPGECLAMEFTGMKNGKVMFKGESVFEVDADGCVGCRQCLQACYFDAVHYDEVTRTCRIDPESCYGCGLCRRSCPVDAVSMAERTGALVLPSAF